MERCRVVPAAYVVLLRDGTDGSAEVLLQLRSGTGYMDGHWACAAAGHVERGESVVQAAVREAAEELGLDVDASDLTPLCGMHRTAGDGNDVNERSDFFFTLRRWRGDARIREPRKAVDLRWFPLAELPDPVVPHELVVLEAVRAGVVPAFFTVGFDGPARPGDAGA
jgi:8-oxo-dGTP pyrophosphatase MutT (NUDIX family)